MFKTLVITPEKVLFEAEARSVFLPGSTGEFEVLEFHKSIISLLRQGNIIINWEKKIPIKRGAVRMSGNELVAVVEQ